MLENKVEDFKIETIIEPVDIECEMGRRHLLDFIIHTWYKKEPFIVGWHIKAICERIDKIIKRYKNGKSSYIAITLPPRHSKSQIVSRSLPAYFKGLFNDSEVMVTGYGDTLLGGFSRDARDKIIGRSFYRDIFGNVRISKKSGSVTNWNIEVNGKDTSGGISYAGILGGLTGKGFDLGICDDPIKGRDEAESLLMRNKIWDEFTDSFLSRMSAVSITIILTTRWHIDDIIGRIEDRMNRRSENYDPDFPVFEIINFPAKDIGYDGGYLFLERFPEVYYKWAFATKSKYSRASLMQGQPVKRGGNLLDVENIKFHNSLSEFPEAIYYRIWDLAHSRKEKVKDEPDWTSGTLMTMTYERVNDYQIPHLWIKDVFRIRESAPKRDKAIIRVTNMDGDTVKVGIEAMTDSKDAYETFKEILKGLRTVIEIKSHKDKVIRAEPLEAIFEAGNVHVLRADWNMEWVNEVSAFPNGKHDDQVDNMSSGYNKIKTGDVMIVSLSVDSGMGISMQGGNLI